MLPNISRSMMRAMVLEEADKALVLKNLPIPDPGERQVLIQVKACGICRTDLHIIDGELKNPKLPLVPGHEIVGVIEKTGGAVKHLRNGDIVGVPWLAYTCGKCKYCQTGHENLCENALFTGYTVNGGFAEYTVAYADYCFKLPTVYTNRSAAPLMCAGLIGYRSYSFLPESSHNIGFYGFGAAAHLLIQIANWEGKKVFVFTRKDDVEGQQFAKELGAYWAGNSEESPPEKLDGAIIFAPPGELVPKALADTDKAGIVLCGGIHMSDIPSFPYHILWEERILRSVANLTRDDAYNFLQIAPSVPLRTSVTLFRLEEANEAIEQLRAGKIHGAAVLAIDDLDF